MIEKYLEITPQIATDAYIAPTASIIGKVTVGTDSSVWPSSVLRGDVNNIEVGARTNIQDGSILHVTHDGPFTPGGQALVIGDDVTIGHKVILHACTINNLCLVGMGSIVLDKVVLEEEVMIGAGSLVPQGKTLKSGYLYLGSPARQVRKLTDSELEFLKYSAQHYVRLKNHYLPI